MEDRWVDEMSQTIFRGSAEQAAAAAAAALAEGVAPAALAEAISLAANQLILRDNGRTAAQARANKPVGSVHGDSIGLHACDSANAWRESCPPGQPAQPGRLLILGAWQVAHDRGDRGGSFLTWQPYPARTPVRMLAQCSPTACCPNWKKLFAIAIRPAPPPWCSAMATAILPPGRYGTCC